MRALEKIKMLSRKTQTKDLTMSLRTSLTSAWNTAEALVRPTGHYEYDVFVMTCWSVKGHLPLIPLLDTDQMVVISKIKLGKNCGSLDQVEDSVD